MHSCRDINYLKSNYIQWEFGLIVVFTGIDSFPRRLTNSPVVLTAITDEINVHFVLHDYKMCF